MVGSLWDEAARQDNLRPLELAYSLLDVAVRGERGLKIAVTGSLFSGSAECVSREANGALVAVHCRDAAAP